jgi:superfamily II DNA or RNA helicase
MINCSIKNRKLYIFDYNDNEKNIIEKLLTFTPNIKHYTKETDIIKLYKIKRKIIICNFGFLGILQQQLQINILNNIDIKFNNLIKYTEINENILSGIKLYDFQKFCIYKCINNKFGSVVSPTGSGKTEIILAIIKTLYNTLNNICIIVPNVLLAEQFRDRAIKRGLPKKDIGIYHGQEKTNDTKIIIFVINSLYIAVKRKNNKIMEFIKNTDITIIDEAHHAQAPTYSYILNKIKSKYMLGFSGSLNNTPEDIISNSHDAYIQGFFGDPIFTINVEHLYQLELLARPFVYINSVGSNLNKKYCSTKYNIVYDRFLINNKQRNDKIINITKYLLQNNLQTLITIQRKSHGVLLLQQIKDERCVCIYGGKQIITYDSEIDQLDYSIYNYKTFIRNFEIGIYNTIIISQTGDEGLDLPNVRCLIVAGGGRSNIKILQRTGRALRNKNLKNIALIMDFYDYGHHFFKNQSIQRIKIYKKLKSYITENLLDFKQQIDEIANLIKNNKN